MTNGVTETPTKGRTSLTSYACSNCPSHKDEDFHAHAKSDDGNFECYVVLDGHGGSHAAVIVQEFMMKRAVEMYSKDKTFIQSDIFELFKEAADRANEAKDNSGTTCTCIFLQRDLESSNVDLHLAWVGDSRGIICQKNKLVVESVDHNLKNPEEKARVLAATNNSVMVLTPQQGPNDAPPSTPPPLELGAAAPVTPPGTNKRKEKVEGGNRQESEDVTTKGGGVYKQLMKAKAESDNSDLEDVTVKGGKNYRRPSATLESNPQDPPPQTPQLGKEPSNQKPHPMDARRGSFIAQRITDSGEQRGPWCLFSGENGTSLAVTRSLGDADAARSCIKSPEIKKLTIKAGEFTRVCMCSDGVWDVLSSIQVAKRISTGSDEATTARKIALITKERRYNTGAGKDDITVFIVDLFAPPALVGCSAGCSIM
ncbi:hypothetical protein TrVE_jg12356 [Triparma verrucosa]|uniref:PPM-type phosphatase domain-containing protein n=1 Tax=Triparma verrucosa TaxID=1606542 RepID=A0A9W7B8I4_9STRA|nr:hypothetical protein TrVE_jg12356 [Triparma verrucosa]